MPEQNNTPTDEGHKGGATAAPASSVRVYNQPQRRGPSLTMIIPIVLALAALAYLLSRTMRRSEPVRQPAVQQPYNSAPSGDRNPPGPRDSGATQGTSNPPGPAGRGDGGR